MNRKLAWTTVVAGLVAAPVAVAFTPELHERLSERAPVEPGEGQAGLEVPGEPDAQRFREALWNAFAATGDDALRHRFLARVPAADRFDARALKSFLFLNPQRPVLGLDRFEGLPADARRLRAKASRWPDDDGRNADRFWLLDDGTLRKGPDGAPLPEDPAILDMGGVQGVSSQAHARYALWPSSSRTDSVEVLEQEPWRFSQPRDAKAFGADFAGNYAEIGVLCRSWEASLGPSATWFATAFEGLAWHHVQEVATQTQAVQVPSGDLFVGAQLSVWVEELRTGGGLFGPRVSVRAVGVRALTHFHLFHERLFSDVVLGCSGGCADPAALGAARALGESDPSFAARLSEGAASGVPLVERTVAALVEVGAPEARVIHDHVRGLADPSIFAWRGREVTDADDPLTFLSSPVQVLEPTADWRGFFEVRARAFRRFNAFVKQAGDEPAGSLELVRDRLLRRLLDRHEELEARRAAFVAPSPGPTGVNKGVVLGLVGLGLLSSLALRSLLRRRRPLPMPARLVDPLS